MEVSLVIAITSVITAGCNGLDPSERPVQFQAISLGDFHICAIATNGSAYCIGSNFLGQLGDGTRTDQTTFVRVKIDQPLSSVAASINSCALTSDGDAYCWGPNFGGQVGDGTRFLHAEPTRVSGGLKFRQLALGWKHTCGVTVDDVAYCWGDNFSGVLGYGSDSEVAQLTPTLVAGGHRFQSIFAGLSDALHSCAITTSGAAYCWGKNDRGQLGNGTTAPSTSPVRVSGDLVFTSLALATSSTCGLTTTRAIYCWGGLGGPLGSATPKAIDVEAIENIAAGNSLYCGNTVDGAAFCLGRTESRFVPLPLPDAQTLGIKQLDANDFSVCGIARTGEAYCWKTFGPDAWHAGGSPRLLPSPDNR